MTCSLNFKDVDSTEYHVKGKEREGDMSLPEYDYVHHQ